MKRLNRYHKYCPLNIKLRHLYKLKQQLNNAYNSAIAKTDESNILLTQKADALKNCDRLINLCWRNHYNRIPGYTVTPIEKYKEEK